MKIIETQQLRKTFGGMLGTPVDALGGVDLEVSSGQAFGLLGPNGAGKTTLVKILLGLILPSAGSAHLFGEPAGSPFVRARVGYMPEQRRYPAFLTAAQVLDFFARLHGVATRQRRRRIDKVLEEVEMIRWLDYRVGDFSKGMQQRLALAQALLPDPDILFLDEPAEGIDPLGRVSIRRTLRRRVQEGCCLFINSHMLTEVERVCDRVAILVDGRVVRAGPLKSLTDLEARYHVSVADGDEATLRGVIAGFSDEVELVQSVEGGLRSFRLIVSERTKANALIDRLREQGFEIDEVRPLRASLEEVFVQTIRGTTDLHEPAS